MRTGWMVLATIVSAMSAPAFAENLYVKGSWPALASDRRPEAVGDSVTIIVSENQQASNTVRKGSRKRTSIDGQITANASFDKSGSATIGGAYEGEGTNTRADRIVAQLTASVQQIMPNGDLLVSGWQRLRINGESTLIRVSGRIRQQDIGPDNTVVSSRLADAVIDYNGRGFASRSAKPGVVTKLFNWLGIL